MFREVDSEDREREGHVEDEPHSESILHYRTETLVELAARHGLAARFMDDWEKLPHRQSKIRVSVTPDVGSQADAQADSDVGSAADSDVSGGP